MPLFILAETSAGYGLFKAKDKKLLEREDVELRLSTAEKINQELKLKEFVKWDSASAAVGEIGALLDGKVPPMLANLMESIKDEKKISLAVADKGIGSALQKLPGFNITTLAAGSATQDLYRGIRTHLSELIPGILPENFKTMALGLSHSLSRHKLRFSAEKVDVMIIQAISLLDDLDKELNTYAMRVKEWYGWHFPELGKILNDNMAYARVILTLGLRSNASKADLSEILPEEIETAVKAAADLSMGTEISEEDLENIRLLAEQVVSYSEYRVQLSSYLEARMRAIAPNLTELVGYLVGARLISHAGSLMNLAKNPGSTIQILGAEKALFRALKTKHATPKYGLIYHASLVGQATGKNKGKIARQLASKAALGVRADALTEVEEGKEVDEDERSTFGIAMRSKVENNLRRLEGKPILAKGTAVGPNGKAAPAPSKWDVKEARKYNVDADGLAGNEPPSKAEKPGKESKPKKSSNKEVVEDVEVDNDADEDEEEEASDEEMDDAPARNGATDGNVPSSPTLSSVSSDSETEPDAPEEEKQWQSSIVGATREAKVARKKERHEHNLQLAPLRAARRAARKAQKQRQDARAVRRAAKQAQIERRANRAIATSSSSVPSSKSTTSAAKSAKSSSSSSGKKKQQQQQQTEADFERLAEAAGISVSKFKRKYERGDVELDEDGNPLVRSKKEMKKLRKALDTAEAVVAEAAAKDTTASKSGSGEKRKRDDEGEKPKKKKKNKHSAS